MEMFFISIEKAYFRHLLFVIKTYLLLAPRIEFLSKRNKI